jgi:hypothetical protein
MTSLNRQIDYVYEKRHRGGRSVEFEGGWMVGFAMRPHGVPFFTAFLLHIYADHPTLTYLNTLRVDCSVSTLRVDCSVSTLKVDCSVSTLNSTVKWRQRILSNVPLFVPHTTNDNEFKCLKNCILVVHVYHRNGLEKMNVSIYICFITVCDR